MTKQQTKSLFKSVDDMESFYQWFNNAGNENMRSLGFSHYHRHFLSGNYEDQKIMVNEWRQSIQTDKK